MNKQLKLLTTHIHMMALNIFFRIQFLGPELYLARVNPVIFVKIIKLYIRGEVFLNNGQLSAKTIWGNAHKTPSHPKRVRRESGARK